MSLHKATLAGINPIEKTQVQITNNVVGDTDHVANSDLLNSLFTFTVTADRTLTLPSAASLITNGTDVTDALWFLVRNVTASTGLVTVIPTGAASGTMTVSPANYRQFFLRFDSVTPGAETYTVIDAGAVSEVSPVGSLINGNLVVTGDASIGGKLTVGGAIDPTALILNGQAAVPQVPLAGELTLWSNNTTVPATPVIDLAGLGSMGVGASALLTPYVVRAGTQFPTIQSAIDAAILAAGAGSVTPETVFIPDGIYTEDLLINGAVNLLGMSQNVLINGFVTIGPDAFSHAFSRFQNFRINSQGTVNPGAIIFGVLAGVNSATAEFHWKCVDMTSGTDFHSGIEMTATNSGAFTVAQCTISGSPGIAFFGNSVTAPAIRDSLVADGINQGVATNMAPDIRHSTVRDNALTITGLFNDYSVGTTRFSNCTFIFAAVAANGFDVGAAATLILQNCAILVNPATWANVGAGGIIMYGGLALQNVPGATDGISGAGTKTQLTLV